MDNTGVIKEVNRIIKEEKTLHDDFNKSTIIELNNKIYDTKIQIAKIKTTLTTKHNYVIFIKVK